MAAFAVSMECYDAMIREDEGKGKRAGAALKTLAVSTTNWWANDYDLFNLALGYDFDYQYMTEEQRAIVRQTIAAATSGKRPTGATSPPDWRNYNWMPRGMSLILSALAIEGEPGYDPSLYSSSLGVMKDFLHYGISEAGGGLEEMHYFHYGMHLGVLAMIAFARRGDNLFADAHYRALPNWLIASMEPFGDAFSMHQDTPNDTGGPVANYAIMKWIWPQERVLDMIWRNRVKVGYQGLTFYGDWLVPGLFPSDPEDWPLYSGKVARTKWGVDEAGKIAGEPDSIGGIGGLNLPLNYWDPERGLLITRDKWGSDGMVVHFDVNAQALGEGSHYHCDSTSFTLSALGRKWVIDRGFHIAETKDSSSVLIDGRGQGFFPVGGKTVEYQNTEKLTTIAADASEPYHWMATTQSRIRVPYLRGFAWEPTTRPELVRKYAEIAVTDKAKPWNDKAAASTYMYRASYNPMMRAFRTVVLRRGNNQPYLVVIDDYKKDDKSHKYDLLLAVPDDLVIASTDDDGRAVVLKCADPKDTRRLLVRMAATSAPGKWELETYEIKRSPETGDTTSFGLGKRLKYSSQAIEPEFKVLLYPYREGSSVPVFSTTPTSIDIVWKDSKDKFGLSQLASGRTAITTQGSN
jgi:hypothetical protein